MNFQLKSLEPYRETHHNYLDALFTTKLGLGYITGVIELILGAVFYIMCLPLVRKSGYFQVRKKNNFCLFLSRLILTFFVMRIVILLVSYVNTSLVGNHVNSWTKFLEMGRITRMFVFNRKNSTLSKISFIKTW